MKAIRVRVLTASDIHQSRLHYRSLVQAVREHRPDVVALVGDALSALGGTGKYQFSAEECAQILSELPVEHVIFVRGNHEDSNWSEFVYAWPHDQRKLVGLYGTAYAAGPLVFDFARPESSSLSKIIINAYPWNQTILI